MTQNKHFSRRDIIKAAAATSGIITLGSMMPTPSIFTPEARAAESDRSTLVVIYLSGGYNALFSSADSFSGAGTFGVTAANQLNLGNGLVVDKTFDTLSAFAKTHMAAVGIRHGQAAHGAARSAQFTVNNQNPVLALASAMGGDGSIKAANIGQDSVPGPTTTVGGVSLQPITDMKAAIDAMGGGAADPTAPKRELAAKGIAASKEMSMTALSGNPESLVTVANGYKAAVETLVKPSAPFNAQELMTAYGLTATTVTDFKSKMAGAELMVRSGANVVTMSDGGWDSHGDRAGASVRQKLGAMMPAIKTFTDRMLEFEGRNVTVVIFGDFARSLPGSDHASVSVATVIGKNVKVGTTGKVDAAVGLPAGTPVVNGFWGYLAALNRCDAAMQGFGGNPHTIITA